MTLTEGQDPERVEQVGVALSALADRVDVVAQTGTSGMGVLGQSWLGPDVESFGQQWQAAQRSLGDAAGMLRLVSERAREQAADQRTASGEGGSGGSVPARTTTDPGGASPPSPGDFELPEEYEDGPQIPFSDKGQVPQGMSYDAAHDELVYTFYDEDDDTDGEIVFVDRETGEVTSRVPLRGQDHYGGVAVDGEYTYVSGGGEVQVYRTEDLRNPPTSSLDLGPLGTFPTTPPAEPVGTVGTAAHSTVTVHDGDLYVTQFKDDGDASGSMYRYRIGEDGSPTGDPVQTYSVPPRTQGVTFDEGGNAYFAQSHGRGNESTLTRLSPDDLASGGWTEGAGTSRTIPNMAEGNVVVDGRLYQLYESGSDKYDDHRGPDVIVGKVLGETDPRDRVTVHDLRR